MTFVKNDNGEVTAVIFRHEEHPDIDGKFDGTMTFVKNDNGEVTAVIFRHEEHPDIDGKKVKNE
jgi:hypothetical protein